jgi:gluconate 2-dehydrogenase gamma chain
MERRDLLKSAFALTTFSLMPACKQMGAGGSSGFLSGDKFLSKDELAFLSSLSDTIIPTTDTPGAVAAKVPETLQDLLSTWASDETRGNWRMLLEGLKAELDKGADGNFTKANAAARAKALGPLDTAIYADAKHKLSAYHDVKKTIGDAYYMSEIGATQELRYNPVPGDWKANVPAQTEEKNWAA